MDKKVRSVEYCVEGIFREINKRKEVDYADKNSVRRYNAAYDRFANHLNYLVEHYPESIHVLVDMLDHHDLRVVSHVAPRIIKLKNATKNQKIRALQGVRKIIASPEVDPLDRMGFSWNLEEWEKEVYSK